MYVARTCTRLVACESGGQVGVEAVQLGTFRLERAYVLLGDAGSGKSTEFRQECAELGDAAVLRSARDFVTLDVAPEWRDKTLFIDGLDEIRAGAADGRPALDEIRRRLDQLGWPRYRISCREADWLGSSDRRSLESATPGETVVVLRLDPLGEVAIGALLAAHLDADAIPSFLIEADQRGLSGMLDNPLTLEMLAVSIAQEGGDWPASRSDTFELACKRMAQEHNDEHIAAAHIPPASEAELIVAGELAAIQLLSGIEGYCLGPTEDNSPYVSLDSLLPLVPEPRKEESGHRRRALGTKLFWAPPGTDILARWPRLAPRHRQIAEFLGGRYLAHLVSSGLPARRVVALMTSPHDGRVVTSLRGLSAWFAAHCPVALDQLIDADPVGVGLYGDISSLNGEQKRRLLHAIAAFAAEGPLLGHEWRDNRGASYRDTTAWAFRSIVDDESIEAVAEFIDANPDDLASERVREFLLQILAVVEEGQIGTARRLSPRVAAVVRDGSQSRHVRLAALDAQRHLMPAGVDRQRELRQLLDDISTGRVPDPNRQLAGSLLYELYPDTVGPDEVLGFVNHPSRERIHGLFEGFWHRELSVRSSGQQAGEILDALHQDADRWVQLLRERHFDDVPVDLLASAVAELGDEVTISRLFNWLSIAGACEPQVMPARSPAAQTVRDWLEARPEIQRRVYLEWLRHRDLNDSLGFRAYDWCLALHGSKLPRDIGRWCLERAMELAQIEPALARELVRRAHATLDDSDTNEGLTADVLRTVVSGCGDLEEFVEALFTPVTPDPKVERMLKEHDERREEWEQERQERVEDWAAGLRSSLSQLQDNTFSSANLHRLALAYMGLYAESDDELDARDSLGEFIGGEEDLVAAVLHAFRESIERPDLPSVEETVTLHKESKHAWLALPALAGLQLLDAEDPKRLDQLDDGLKRQALALLFCVPTNTTSLPPWFERWFEGHPLLVAEVAITCAIAAIRNGDEHPPGLSELDSIGGDGGVKHTVKLRLLRSIPTRGSNAQLRLLDRLLLDAMAYSDSDGLQELIDEKLTVTSMTVAQRSRWLTAAALLFEGEYVSALIEHVEAHRSAVRHVAEFFHSDHGPGISGHPGLTASLSSGTLAAFVQMLGRAYPPLERDGWITVEIDAADRIRDMIHQLAQSPDNVAGEALRRMEHDPELSEWQAVLRWRREEQSAIQRDAEYRHPGVREVQQTLSGGIPANAADLAALLLDRLDDVGRQMRGDSSNPWASYWNVDAHGRPVSPRPENVGRDSLLTLLKNHPTLSEVDLGPEGSYAAGKRADIRASCAGFNVPIEIKRESHSDLWHAMHGQLIGQYTTDPSTEGFGIYLVLWFGGEKMPTPPSGRRPGNPDELRAMLEARLDANESRKISARVLDVTKPGS